MYVPYEGGPVVYCPVIYTSFWGPSWSSSPNSQLSSQLNQFAKDLLVSNFMNVLTQYGPAGTGLFSQASYLAHVPATLTVSSYQAILQSCINAGVLPEPANVNTAKIGIPIVLIFLDQNVIINGGGRQLNFPGAPDLGYHEWMITAAGNPLLYAFMWYNSDIGQITWVATHEFAETMTDPLYSAWTPDHAYHEIGDYCDGNTADIVVSGRTWLIQTVWSNTNDSCVAEAPSKLPPLHPGPFGAATAAARQGRGPSAYPEVASIRSHERLLPLPSVHFNHLANTVQMSDAELMAYTRKLFHPLRHEHLFQSFPNFLHQAANAIEGRLSRAATSRNGGEQTSEAAGPSIPQAELVGRGRGVVRGHPDN